MNLKNYKDSLVNELKKFTNYEDLKKVDKKILIPFFVCVIVFLALYYFFLFTKYPVFKNLKNSTLKNEQNIVNTVPKKSEKNDEINALIANFFKSVSDRDYDKITGYLNKDFIDENNITKELITDYFETQYPEQIDYTISKIMYNEINQEYVVVLKFNNINPDSKIYYRIYDNEINYYFKKQDNEFKVSIPHILQNDYYTSRGIEEKMDKVVSEDN